MGQLLAQILGRKLLFSNTLRIRRCDDAILCASSPCELHGAEYHCPLSRFIDLQELERSSGIIFVRQQQEELLQNLGSYHDTTAFNEFYDSNILLLDRIPNARKEGGYIHGNGKVRGFLAYVNSSKSRMHLTFGNGKTSTSLSSSGNGDKISTDNRTEGSRGSFGSSGGKSSSGGGNSDSSSANNRRNSGVSSRNSGSIYSSGSSSSSGGGGGGGGNKGYTYTHPKGGNRNGRAGSNSRRKLLDSAQNKDEAIIKFTYYKAQGSCLCTVESILRQTWRAPSLHPATNKSIILIDLQQRYNQVREPILFLHGTPHRVGRLPLAWSSKQAMERAMDSWLSNIPYHPNIDAHARQLIGLLLANTSTSSFICVHVRRDDFTDLGWNKGDREDKIASKVEENRCNMHEAIYVATDEERPEALTRLRNAFGQGTVFYSDFAQSMLLERTPDRNMLGFKDYIGVVEQRACALARRFVGSTCSSFSGSILSMRRSARSPPWRPPIIDNEDAE